MDYDLWTKLKSEDLGKPETWLATQAPGIVGGGEIVFMIEHSDAATRKYSRPKIWIIHLVAVSCRSGCYELSEHIFVAVWHSVATSFWDQKCI